MQEPQLQQSKPLSKTSIKPTKKQTQKYFTRDKQLNTQKFTQICQYQNAILKKSQSQHQQQQQNSKQLKNQTSIFHSKQSNINNNFNLLNQFSHPNRKQLQKTQSSEPKIFTNTRYSISIHPNNQKNESELFQSQATSSTLRHKKTSQDFLQSINNNFDLDDYKENHEPNLNNKNNYRGRNLIQNHRCYKQQQFLSNQNSISPAQKFLSISPARLIETTAGKNNPVKIFRRQSSTASNQKKFSILNQQQQPSLYHTQFYKQNIQKFNSSTTNNLQQQNFLQVPNHQQQQQKLFNPNLSQNETLPQHEYYQSSKISMHQMPSSQYTSLYNTQTQNFDTNINNNISKNSDSPQQDTQQQTENNFHNQIHLRQMKSEKIQNSSSKKQQLQASKSYDNPCLVKILKEIKMQQSAQNDCKKNRRQSFNTNSDMNKEKLYQTSKNFYNNNYASTNNSQSTQFTSTESQFFSKKQSLTDSQKLIISNNNSNRSHLNLNSNNFNKKEQEFNSLIEQISPIQTKKSNTNNNSQKYMSLSNSKDIKSPFTHNNNIINNQDQNQQSYRKQHFHISKSRKCNSMSKSHQFEYNNRDKKSSSSNQIMPTQRSQNNIRRLDTIQDDSLNIERQTSIENIHSPIKIIENNNNNLNKNTQRSSESIIIQQQSSSSEILSPNTIQKLHQKQQQKEITKKQFLQQFMKNKFFKQKDGQIVDKMMESSQQKASMLNRLLGTTHRRMSILSGYSGNDDNNNENNNNTNEIQYEQVSEQTLFKVVEKGLKYMTHHQNNLQQYLEKLHQEQQEFDSKYPNKNQFLTINTNNSLISNSTNKSQYQSKQQQQQTELQNITENFVKFLYERWQQYAKQQKKTNILLQKNQQIHQNLSQKYNKFKSEQQLSNSNPSQKNKNGQKILLISKDQIYEDHNDFEILDTYLNDSPKNYLNFVKNMKKSSQFFQTLQKNSNELFFKLKYGIFKGCQKIIHPNDAMFFLQEVESLRNFVVNNVYVHQQLDSKLKVYRNIYLKLITQMPNYFADIFSAKIVAYSLIQFIYEGLNVTQIQKILKLNCRESINKQFCEDIQLIFRNSSTFKVPVQLEKNIKYKFYKLECELQFEQSYAQYFSNLAEVFTYLKNRIVQKIKDNTYQITDLNIKNILDFYPIEYLLSVIYSNFTSFSYEDIRPCIDQFVDKKQYEPWGRIFDMQINSLKQVLQINYKVSQKKSEMIPQILWSAVVESLILK